MATWKPMSVFQETCLQGLARLSLQLWTTKAHKLVILVGSWWICEIFPESCSDFQKTMKTPPPKFFPQVVSNGQIFGVNTYQQKWVWAMKISWGESTTTVKCVSATYNHCGLSEVHSLLSTSLFPCQSHGWEFMRCNAQAIFVLWWLQNLLSQCCGLWPIMETNEWYNWAPFWKKKVSSVKVKHFFVSQPRSLLSSTDSCRNPAESGQFPEFRRNQFWHSCLPNW